MNGKGKGKFIIAIIAIIAIAALLYIQFVWLPSKSKGNLDDFELVEAKVMPPKGEQKHPKVWMKVRNTGEQDYFAVNAQVVIKKDNENICTENTALNDLEAGKEIEKEVVLTKIEGEDVAKVISPDAKVEVVFSECRLKE